MTKTAKTARIGIFSGTFDPVHHGHLVFARAAMAAAKLDKVVLLPEAEPRGKQGVTSLTHRLEMLRLATHDTPEFEVLSLASLRFDVAHTLPQLVQQFHGAELVLLVGSDVAQTFGRRWPGLEVLLSTVELVIGLREGDDQAAIEMLMGQLQEAYPMLTPRYRFVSANPYAHGASSRVRQAVRTSNETIPHIADYIVAHRLYPLSETVS